MGESGILDGLSSASPIRRLWRARRDRGRARLAAGRAPAAGRARRRSSRRTRSGCAERLRLSNAEAERLRRAATALARLHGVATAPSDDTLRPAPVSFRPPRRRSTRSSGAGRIRPHAPGTPASRTPKNSSPRRRSRVRPSAEGRSWPGGAAGPRVAEILRAFERLWEDAGFPTDAGTCLSEASFRPRRRIGAMIKADRKIFEMISIGPVLHEPGERPVERRRSSWPFFRTAIPERPSPKKRLSR